MITSKYRINKKVFFIPIVFGVLSSIIIYLKLKPNESFLKNWLPFYLSGVFIVAPIAITAFIFLNKTIDKYMMIENLFIKRFIFKFFFSGFVGLLLSTSFVVVISDYINTSEFIINWRTTISNFLPRALIIGPLLSGIANLISNKLKDRRKQ